MKVLLADNDAIARLLVSRAICSLGFEVLTATDGEDAWSILQEENGPQLAVIDWNIGGLAVRSMCERARSMDDGRCRYLVSLVPRNSEAALWAVQSGCDDYLYKPIDTAELRARLRLAARVIDVTNRLADAEPRQADQEGGQASHDQLTGVWNRAAMIEFLHGQVARSGREGVSLAVAVADVDNFSVFNEKYGRSCGDAALKSLAGRIRNAIRPYDWLGRSGDDSFLIIAPDCTLSNGFAMCERLRSMISATAFNVKGSVARMTISFGLATSAESGAAGEDTLVRAAESALVVAKQNGRNRVETAKRAARVRGAQARPVRAPHRELVQ